MILPQCQLETCARGIYLSVLPYSSKFQTSRSKSSRACFIGRNHSREEPQYRLALLSTCTNLRRCLTCEQTAIYTWRCLYKRPVTAQNRSRRPRHENPEITDRSALPQLLVALAVATRYWTELARLSEARVLWIWTQVRACSAVVTSKYDHDLSGFALVPLLIRLVPCCSNCAYCFGASKAHCRNMQQHRTQSHGGICDVLRVSGRSHGGTRSSTGRLHTVTHSQTPRCLKRGVGE